MEPGWIKLDRSLLDDAVFMDERLLRLLVWCKLRANYASQQFHGETIAVGEFVTSMERAGEALGCAKSTAWRGLEKLASPEFGFLRLRLVANAKRKFTVVTVVDQTISGPAEDGMRNGSETVAERERNGRGTGAKQIEEGKKVRTQEGEKETPPKAPRKREGGSKPTKSRFDPATAEIPQSLRVFDFQAKAWPEWIEYRREIRKPLTERTCREQLESMARAGPVAAVTAIRESIRAGWTGIFPEGSKNGRSAPPPGPGQRFDPASVGDELDIVGTL